MSESADAETFRARLWEMVPQRLGAQLTLPEFDRLRGLLFPEIRSRQIGLPLEANPAARDDSCTNPSLFRVRLSASIQYCSLEQFNNHTVKSVPGILKRWQKRGQIVV